MDEFLESIGPFEKGFFEKYIEREYNTKKDYYIKTEEVVQSSGENCPSYIIDVGKNSQNDEKEGNGRYVYERGIPYYGIDKQIFIINQFKKIYKNKDVDIVIENNEIKIRFNEPLKNEIESYIEKNKNYFMPNIEQKS